MAIEIAIKREDNSLKDNFLALAFLLLLCWRCSKVGTSNPVVVVLKAAWTGHNDRCNWPLIRWLFLLVPGNVTCMLPLHHQPLFGN